MSKNREGKNVPQVTFHTRHDHEWLDRSTDEIFKGKTVVVFSLPGAFTPTCSSTHVPRYNQLAPTFARHGVDEVVCISVNDAFVMNEWRREQKAMNVTFLPDGNGDFSRGMGMLVAKNDLAFGDRSWRYSMLVKDGVIEKMFIEPNEPGDPFEVSDADTMLEFIAPGAGKPLTSRCSVVRVVLIACAPRVCCTTPASVLRSWCLTGTIQRPRCVPFRDDQRYRRCLSTAITLVIPKPLNSI